jgi:hydrogenase maturation protein HypF
MSLKSAMRTEGKSYRIIIKGLVQGVGFRPFLYQLAQEFGLQGWVMNTGAGVTMEIHGTDAACIDQVLASIHSRKPGAANLQRIAVEEVKAADVQGFVIRASQALDIATRIPLDLAPCRDCLEELHDPSNRRYQYPFISCSVCGPRFTILKQLPFDRKNTTLVDFPLCELCQQEYDDPRNRRFHAQTLSCADCGPLLKFFRPPAEEQWTGMSAMGEALTLLREGGILAVKGIGGYQLAALATHGPAVSDLRRRKKRPEKPLAVMFPNGDALDQVCLFNDQERRLLADAAAPIILLAWKNKSQLCKEVSFDLPLCGAMLPSSPLHELLLHALQEPLVMTSANLSGSPLLIDEDVNTLQQLADGALIHNRCIAHRADDSVLRLMGDEAVALRRGRGLAPYTLDFPGQYGLRLALGGEEKNTFALQKNETITVSQHIGHLANRETSDFWEDEITAFCEILGVQAEEALHDLHPDYHSTQRASALTPKTRSVPHHEAHIFSCLAERRPPEKALALAWDGAGLGEDGTIWGGEGFLWNPENRALPHIASWFPFPWIGGDRMAREPRRSALAIGAVLFGASLDDSFLKPFYEWDMNTLTTVMQDVASFPQTSSVGRLFDAVASFLDLRQICSFEGQAAMLLEGLADSQREFKPFPIGLLQHGDQWLWDWRTMFKEILGAHHDQLPAAWIATRFHQSLVHAAEQLMEKLGLKHLIISGGVFQNRFLVETFQRRAGECGYQLWNSALIPPNDAGLSVGQIASINRQRSAACVSPFRV